MKSAPERILVYDLRLEDDGSPSKEKSYIRLPAPIQPYVLRLSIESGSSASRNGKLYTTLPQLKDTFDRSHHQVIDLPDHFNKPIHIDLPIIKAGAFEYSIEYDKPEDLDQIQDASNSPKRVRSRHGYFNVDPVLHMPLRTDIINGQQIDWENGGALTGKSGPISIDGLVIQSVIGKWMGAIHEWEPHIKLIHDAGYNMIHFTPLQERGKSNSPYSIYDQLDFSKDLFSSSEKTPDQRSAAMAKILQKIQTNHGILAMTDVVWNHTAHNSAWLLDHPEAGYNAVNSPHLESALEVDTALLEFSKGLKSYGLPTLIKSQQDLDKIAQGIKDHVLPKLRLWEYYALDVKAEKDRFQRDLGDGSSQHVNGNQSRQNYSGVVNLASLNVLETSVADLARTILEHGVIGSDTLGGRSARRLNKDALQIFTHRIQEDPWRRSLVEDKFAQVLDIINVKFYAEYDDDVKSIIEQTCSRAKYVRLEENGPKLGEITEKSPLIETLFTRLSRDERTDETDTKASALANNGWIWNANPLQDFASPPSKAYLRREVIVWGDCVKLRYGQSPEDNPWLWEHMTKYTEMVAGLFQGIRIDNCHSTPIHVAEYLLDAARRVNENLYVCAELFTGSEEMDIHFVSRLGINSLIREAMNGWDAKEESRLIYRHGIGKPIGSMDSDCLSEETNIKPILQKDHSRGELHNALVVPVQGSSPHALFMDVTHDNEASAQKRTAEDALATGALVAFSTCAVGSNRGFDDLYPKLLDVVKETRHYYLPARVEESGIGKVKRLLNHLHVEMCLAGYGEGHVHQENDYIVIHRKHPSSHQGYLLIAHTAISSANNGKGDISPTVLDGTRAEYLFAATLDVQSHNLAESTTTLMGLKAVLHELSPHPAIFEHGRTVIHIPEKFASGSIAVYKTWIEGLGQDLHEFCLSQTDIFADLNLIELNTVLYKCDGEEWDTTSGHDGVYNIPSYGKLVYAGLEGWMHPLRKIMRYNDLGHSLCDHLRQGDWAMDYVANRLTKRFSMSKGLENVALWYRTRFERIKKIPSFLKPKYFAIVVSRAYKAACSAAVEQMDPFIRDSDAFTQALALTSIQMHGLSRSASLYPNKSVPSLAAGLPHFTHEWARCWGRDVFICLRGLCLVTGRWDVAFEHICAFATVLKHGLIPNLLDSGNIPRYNSRDSPWFFLQSIQDYAMMAPNGSKILKAKIKRRFGLDDEIISYDDPNAYIYSSTIGEVIQEIMQRHVDGISFREYKAGQALDMQMSDRGFNIDISVDWENGLVFGGSQYNCGTWMDKMGESAKAGSKGVPGTPRDGAAIEITGLLKSTVRWLAELSRKGQFEHDGVDAKIGGTTRRVTYKEWDQLIQKLFEKCYYVPLDPSEDGLHDVNSKVVNRRGIYKDLYRSGKEYEDYQLRANFPIAMTVAPELFDPEHALNALILAHKVILGPLGMATLDPSDQEYRPTYDNANDSDDFKIAKGRNYHQGPEWVWLIGFFLRAYYQFDIKVGAGRKDRTVTLHHIHKLLLRHRQHVADSPWAGLPELTNRAGAECHDSCDTQAWSNSCILDFLYDSRTN